MAKLLALTQNQRNLFLYATPTLVSRLLSLLLLPILTRALSPSDFGLASVAMVIAGLNELVVLPGIETVYLRYGFSGLGSETTRLSESFTVLRRIHLVLVFIVFPIMSFPTILLSGYFAPNVPVLFLAVAMSATCLTSLHAPYLCYLRASQKITALARFQVAECLLRLFVVLMALWVWQLGSLSILIGELIPAFVLFPVSLRIFLKSAPMGLKQSQFFPLLRALLTAGPDAIVFWAFTAVDRFLLNFFKGAAATGLYAAAYPFGSFIVSIEFIFQRQLKTLIYQLCEPQTLNRELVHRLFLSNLKLFLGFSALCALLLPPLLPFLLSVKFGAAANLVPVVCLIAFLRGPEFFFKTLCWADHRKRRLTYANAVALILFVAGNLFFIPRWGGFGAAWAGVLGLLVYPIFIGIYRSEFPELGLSKDFWSIATLFSITAFMLSVLGLPIGVTGVVAGILTAILIGEFLRYLELLGSTSVQ